MLEKLWRKGNPLTLLVGMQTSTATMENSVEILKKLEIELPYDSAIPLLGIHTEETRIERDMRTSVFIAALFIIGRSLKQPRCPSTDEWIRKLWYIYMMEYYSANKKNAFKSVLYIYVSFAALHIESSLPSFKIPYICVNVFYWCFSF